MQVIRCKKDCDYLINAESEKPYCLKSSRSIKDIGACPLKWVTATKDQYISIKH